MDDQTVVFADLAGFTALTEAHGDIEAVALLDRFEALARPAIDRTGRLVKTIGDALMLSFARPLDAVAATQSLFANCAGEIGFPDVRAGLHHGPVVERDGDLFGTTVNIAARVTGHAAGGQALATAAVVAGRELAVPTIALGPVRLRNVGDPVELFDLIIGPDDDETPVDPVCRMRVKREQAAGRLRHGEAAFWFCSLRCASAFATDPDRYDVATHRQPGRQSP